MTFCYRYFAPLPPVVATTTHGEQAKDGGQFFRFAKKRPVHDWRKKSQSQRLSRKRLLKRLDRNVQWYRNVQWFGQAGEERSGVTVLPRIRNSTRRMGSPFSPAKV